MMLLYGNDSGCHNPAFWLPDGSHPMSRYHAECEAFAAERQKAIDDEDRAWEKEVRA